MGPIEKKIETLIKKQTQNIEMLGLLISLQEEVSELEKKIVNEAYFHGYSDKEKNKGLNWNYYQRKYPNMSQSKK
jgi:hypothetical protein